MRNSEKLPRGVVKFCAGVVEQAREEPYISAVRKAANGVGEWCYTKEQVEEKARLAAAIRLNLINHRQWPAEHLFAVFDIHMHEKTFFRERSRFCLRLAKELGFYDDKKTGGIQNG